MNELLPVVKLNAGYQWRINGPALVVFDHANDRLVVSVYGEPPSGGYGAPGVVDRAKEALEYIRAKALPMIGPSIRQTFGVGLKDSDFTLVY